MGNLFKNKVAFITGASAGIGAAIARKLAEQGASVCLFAIRVEPLKELENEILAFGGNVISVAGDVSKPQEVEQAILTTVNRFGGLHLAVNNAGISGDFGILHETTLENWRNVLSVNLDGIFYGMKYQLREMLQFGGGSIVNIGSVEATTILPLNPSYTTSKHAIIGLTKTAAHDYASKGIRINVVSPGVINTPLVQSKPEISSAMGKVVPIGRIGEPDEIANIVSFVLSDNASYMTGVEVIADGGFLLHKV